MSNPRRGRRVRWDGPRRLAEGLDEAVADLGPSDAPSPPATALAAVFAHWEEIAGAALARHAQPVRLNSEVLVVAVDQPAWATQVRALARTLLDRVEEIAGQAPGRLEVRVRPR